MREVWTAGESLELSHLDPASTRHAPGDRAACEALLPKLHDELADLQSRLWAEARRSLLVVLQAMDAGGKDGTIKHVFAGVNPQATRVAAFKEPTPIELSHDFLWRVHQHTPGAGEVAIFNRSHYEDVLVTVVHGSITAKVQRRRFGMINDFEALLGHGGTTVVKLFLHISRDEQLRRLRERLERPDKRWKLRPADFTERSRWDAYQAAYEAAITHTSKAAAPWYVIPADHKWYRNWAVSTILVETLREMDPRYPEPEPIDPAVLAAG